MAKRRKKGIRVIDIIVVIIIIIIAIMIIKNIKQNSDKDEKTIQTSRVQTEQQEKYTKVLEDETKLNTSEKLKEDKKLDGLEVKDIQLTYKNGITNLLATIENKTKTKTPMQEVKIILLDEKGNELYTLPGIIEEIEPGETKQFNTSITADFSNAYNFEIRKK